MRSATRRARSALATYRKLFTKAELTRMEKELKWLARILGRPRDAEVMRARLRQHILALSTEDRSGPILEPIEHELGTAYNAGHKKALKVLGTDRYYRLHDIALHRVRKDAKRLRHAAESVTGIHG